MVLFLYNSKLWVDLALKIELLLVHVSVNLDAFCSSISRIRASGSLRRVISPGIFFCSCCSTNVKWFDLESQCSVTKVIVRLEVVNWYFILVQTGKRENRALQRPSICFYVQSIYPWFIPFVSDDAAYQHFPTTNKLKEEEKQVDLSVFSTFRVYGWQMFENYLKGLVGDCRCGSTDGDRG